MYERFTIKIRHLFIVCAITACIVSGVWIWAVYRGGQAIPDTNEIRNDLQESLDAARIAEDENLKLREQLEQVKADYSKLEDDHNELTGNYRDAEQIVVNIGNGIKEGDRLIRELDAINREFRDCIQEGKESGSN